MQLITLSIQGLSVTMVEIDGMLWCSNSMAAQGLGCSEQNLLQTYQRHKKEFSDSSTLSCRVSELRPHAEALGAKQIRKNTRFWSEDDLLVLAVLSRTDIGVEFRKEFVKLMKANARRDLFTKDQMEMFMMNATKELREELKELKEFVGYARPTLERASSAAGTALNAFRRRDPSLPN